MQPDDRSAFWEEAGADWPNREASRFIDVPPARPAGRLRLPGLRWHVQQAGAGPVLLLLHGTGAATHSWRGLLPLLTPDFTVIAPDLPGHGFTEMPAVRRLSLPRMAQLLERLLDTLDVRPDLVVGHSAGAAVMVRMALDGLISPAALIGINAALLPFRGIANRLFPPMAKMLFLNPVAPRMFAWRATDPSAVARLVNGTGSQIDAAGLAQYARLFRHTGHISGALGMMAHWELDELGGETRSLEIPLTLITGSADRAVPPDDAERIKQLRPETHLVSLPGLGHLAHEEQPESVVPLIGEVARANGVLPA